MSAVHTPRRDAFFFGDVPQRVELVVRCRKDAKLRRAALPEERGF
jgi:hypothetical protein